MSMANAHLGMFCAWLTIFVVLLSVSGCGYYYVERRIVVDEGPPGKHPLGPPGHRIDGPHKWQQ